VKGSNAPRGKCLVLKSVTEDEGCAARGEAAHSLVCRQRRKQGKLKSNGTQAKRRCACWTSTWAARAAARGEAESRTNITPPFTFTVFQASKSPSPPYRTSFIAALETKPALPASPRPTLADRQPHPRAHPSAAPLQTTTTTMSEAYERERYTPRPLAPSRITNPPTNHPPLHQAKQRLPRLPASQSLAAALRDRRHLRQCARPACHRQHLRVLLQHDHQYQRQRAKAGSHGEPGKQSRCVQTGGDHRCDGRGALVDTELVLVKGKKGMI
jgi:hypothetical protein